MATLSATVDLTPAAASVPTARRVAVEVLAAWGAPHDLGDAGLLVSELVANVVDHVGGESAFTLEVTLSGDWLRISVADGSAIRPVVRELEGDSPRGRGMRLVQQIADRWGVEDHEGGKRVWLELARPADCPGGCVRRHPRAGLPRAATGEGSGDTDRPTGGDR